MQSWILVFAVISVGICANSTASAEDSGSGSGDSSILIYSSSHAGESVTKVGQGILHVGISAFETIVSVDVNGSAVDITPGDKVEIEYPYQLEPGQNELVVTARTKTDQQEKRFAIYFGERVKESPFRFIVIAGYTALDNVTSSGSDSGKKSESKSSLALVPIVPLYDGVSSHLRLKGILLREKFAVAEYESNEISYTKLAIEWELDGTSIGDFTTEAGLNDIRTDNQNPLLGEDESATEFYLSGMTSLELGNGQKADARLQMKLKDSKTDITNPDIDADGRVTELRGRYHFRAYGIRGTGKAVYEVIDARGKYKDSSAIKLGIRARYPIDGRRSFGGGYDYKLKTAAVDNALYGGVKPEEQVSIFELNFRFNIHEAGCIDYKIRVKNQDSNIETSEYRANEAVLSYTHAF